ncbi:MAG: ABC transporter permease [Pyrinomonadaceae bacterium]
MSAIDILLLAMRNLREARLRSSLTAVGVAVGVAVVVTMVSFGLGLQRNTISRFRDIELFNEVTVFGRSLTNIVSGEEDPERRARPGGRSESPSAPSRILNDAAIADIAKVAGVDSVEPTIFFTAYLRSNNRALLRPVGGTVVPQAAARFKEFSAGAMIAAAGADEAVVDESFVRDFGYAKASDAIGQRIEFLAPPDDGEQEEPLSFFGFPLGEDEKATPEAEGAQAPSLAARSFLIAGVLKEPETNNAGGRRVRGLSPVASVYIPTAAARDWAVRYRSALNEVALQPPARAAAWAQRKAKATTRPWFA